jgi:hypothetical protein
VSTTIDKTTEPQQYAYLAESIHGRLSGILANNVIEEREEFMRILGEILNVRDYLLAAASHV